MGASTSREKEADEVYFHDEQGTHLKPPPAARKAVEEEEAGGPPIRFNINPVLVGHVDLPENIEPLEHRDLYIMREIISDEARSLISDLNKSVTEAHSKLVRKLEEEDEQVMLRATKQLDDKLPGIQPIPCRDSLDSAIACLNGGAPRACQEQVRMFQNCVEARKPKNQ